MIINCSFNMTLLLNNSEDSRIIIEKDYKIFYRLFQKAAKC